MAAASGTWRVAGDTPGAAQTRRRTSSRIKMSRELMLRLSEALGRATASQVAGSPKKEPAGVVAEESCKHPMWFARHAVQQPRRRPQTNGDFVGASASACDNINDNSGNSRFLDLKLGLTPAQLERLQPSKCARRRSPTTTGWRRPRPHTKSCAGRRRSPLKQSSRRRLAGRRLLWPKQRAQVLQRAQLQPERSVLVGGRPLNQIGTNSDAGAGSILEKPTKTKQETKKRRQKGRRKSFRRRRRRIVSEECKGNEESVIFEPQSNFSLIPGEEEGGGSVKSFAQAPEVDTTTENARPSQRPEPTRTRKCDRGVAGLFFLAAAACCWLLLMQPTATSADNATTDELSRAVMATMSTQRPLELLNKTRPFTHLSLDDDGITQPTPPPPPLEEPEVEQAAGLEKLLDFGRIFIMTAIIVGDICGNSLVILSVCRHSKLRVTTNWFVVSLACADILVALFAMTFNASVIISGRWLFKPWVCDFWNSCDVLASTASILHLCCISVDRYIAIMRPLDYPMKITTRRVVYILCGVWISSALLSYLPIFTGVYTTSEHIKWLEENPDQCEFVVNRVYAIVSSSISFWIPCCIMVFVYYRIYREASRQEKFIYKAQSMMPAPMANHHHHHQQHSANNCAKSAKRKQGRSKSVAAGTATAGQSELARIKQLALQKNRAEPAIATTNLTATPPPRSSEAGEAGAGRALLKEERTDDKIEEEKESVAGANAAEEEDSNSGQSTPTKRSISKMKREHKAAKTLGIIMGVFILCWLPFFSWYTPSQICGRACDKMVPRQAVTILFWIGYFNSTLNPIIYAYFNHEFRDAFKKTLQWIFCCCNDLKCLRVNRPNDNQHYNCTYRSTQEIGLVNS